MDIQAHGGAVNTSTTPSVQYAYTVMSGGQNNSRLTSITYPNGKVLSYNYNSGVDSTISRLSSLSDNSGTPLLPQIQENIRPSRGSATKGGKGPSPFFRSTVSGCRLIIMGARQAYR